MLILGRVVNVFVPVLTLFLSRNLNFSDHKVVDTLTGTPGHPPRFAWDQILIFVVLRLLQGGVGLLQNIQSFMWIPIGQYTTKQISVAMFKHLHSLSLRFHITRKTGEILRVLDRGTSSIVSLLQSILFNIVPVLVDISVAVAFFITMFDIYFGIIVAVTMLGYIAATVSITEWRTKFRREMIELDNRSNQIGVDSLLNFETVKYYCAEDFETDRYSKAIDSYQIADFRSSASLNFLNTTQNFIINGGLLVGSLLCAYRVVQGVLTVGDFVLYLTYISQLYGPLNWFGTMYRMIQQNFIDMEKMLKLFEEDGDIKDAPMANELVLKGGSIVFDNVSFSYDPRHPALKNINFKIPAGSTVALVGPSGGGKSSILKLLFRFYDVKSGRILIDGQDIRSISQRSLRQAVGVVPQDTVLFNESVGYNIRYAKPTATDEEVYQAAKAAQIHEKILSFPDKYETVVGERGLRLSGGEKQRVAIARTILKDPAIILLDEATSSLDTGTERQIQAALHQLSKNRTSLVVAHRLSTIVNSDLILVIKDGMVIDQGTHEQLLKKEDGLYHQLWHQQLKEENN
ncbi:P-loop containing nucleoside triphosphate hydrolase protein [Paraphysoderma sedebokerense]|nr:P-loop containing nucleoside triphosphate hydrolase protein [Paraphysoderma sedebokerense]